MAAPLPSTSRKRIPVFLSLSSARFLPILLAGVWAPYGGLEAQEPTEMTTREQAAVFRSTTSLVLVPVVVRDSQGRVVTNLRREDFRLADAGKVQEISKFSVENRAAPGRATAGASPAGPEQPKTGLEGEPATGLAERFVIYLFDDIHTKVEDLLQVREAAERHLTADLGPADRAAIFTTSGQYSQDFTGDRPALLKALAGIVPRANPRLQDCNETTYYIGDRYRNLHDPDADTFLELLVKACNPNVDGPELLPLKEAMAMRAVTFGERDTRMALNSLGNAIRRLATMPGRRAVVLVSPGFVAREVSTEKTELIERAVRAGVAISALDARGLASYAPTAEDQSQLGGLQAQSLRSRMDRAAALEQGDVLGEFADGAGGVWIHNTNDLAAGLRTAASPPECVYVLAFAPQNLKYDGRFHSLKVTVRGSYTVQARRGYWAPSRMMDAEEQAREEVREALYSRDEISEIPLEVRTQFFKPNDVSAQIAVIVRVDAQQLRYRKADGRNHNVLTVVTAVFDRDGKWMSGNEKTLTLRLKDDTLTSRVAAGLSLRSSFSVVPGLYQVRVVIRDSEGQSMAARNAALDIP